MDRHDLQPAARRVEDFGEQLPRLRAGLRSGISTDRFQIVEQQLVGFLHPGREQLVDAFGHFGGTGFGEGDAQQILGLDPLFEQQPDNARSQNLCLAGTR